MVPELITTLLPGSIVVVVGERRLSAPAGVTVLELAPDASSPAETLVAAALGSVPQRPRRHFQIDVVVAESEPRPDVRDALLELLHPGGWWLTRVANGYDSERPELGPETVEFAKLRPDERRWLYEQVRALPPGVVYVEIGSYKGGSAVIAALANPEIRIYCVDPWAAPHVRGTASGHNFTNGAGVRKGVGVYFSDGLRGRVARLVPVRYWYGRVAEALRPPAIALGEGDSTIWCSGERRADEVEPRGRA